MLIFLWVLLRLTLIFGTIFVLSLFLVVRAMARQVREDRSLGSKRKGIRPYNFNHHLVGAAVVMVVGFGVHRHEWKVAIAGCGLVLGILGIAWLDKARDGAISRACIAFFEVGPASDDLWFRAAAAVGIVLLLDTFITGEWRFSPGLAIALLWCLCWGFFTRHFRQRSEMQAHYKG